MEKREEEKKDESIVKVVWENIADTIEELTNKLASIIGVDDDDLHNIKNNQ